MNDPGRWTARHPRAAAEHGPGPRGGPPETATIVVAGVVHHLEGLRGLGQIQRARWGVLVPSAARWPADLVVVGRSSPSVDAVAVIAGLKEAGATAHIPVLHVAPHETGCAECRADVCLTEVPVAGQLARVASVLIELGEARVALARLEA